jgi:hypothetical protein
MYPPPPKRATNLLRPDSISTPASVPVPSIKSPAAPAAVKLSYTKERAYGLRPTLPCAIALTPPNPLPPEIITGVQLHGVRKIPCKPGTFDDPRWRCAFVHRSAAPPHGVIATVIVITERPDVANSLRAALKKQHKLPYASRPTYTIERKYLTAASAAATPSQTKKKKKNLYASVYTHVSEIKECAR